MSITIRPYKEMDILQMKQIWNGIVAEGIAFPEENELTTDEAADFFHKQSYTGVAEENGRILGLYILHPNFIGRCSHIANASYGVATHARGRSIGEQLVRHSLQIARSLDFRLLQFNAVVETNASAIHLYKKLGFTPLGTIPGGFRQKDGTYVNMIPFYKNLVD